MKHISNVTIAKAQSEEEGTNIFDVIISLLGGTSDGGANIFDVIVAVLNKPA